MSRDIDALTSYTLKHLRDRWWTSRWTHWVSSHLRCDAGERLVHVGCGNGEIDVALALLTPALSVVSVDVLVERARHTHELAGEVDARVAALAGDLRALPLAPASADAVLCIGVLQHLQDPAAATRHLAALLRPGGRILVVEPDHEARYWFSAAGSGARAFAVAREVLGGLHREAAPDAPSRLGVHIPEWLRQAGLEPLSVEAVPVSESRLGAPPAGVWEARQRVVAEAPVAAGRADARQTLLDAIAEYRAEADLQGPAFVEVQHAVLLATLAQRPH